MKKKSYYEQQLALIPKDRQAAVLKQTDEIIKLSRLNRLRESVGLTQQQVADKLAIKQASISQIETGEDPRLSTLIRYISALGGKLSLSVTMPEGAEYDLTPATTSPS